MSCGWHSHSQLRLKEHSCECGPPATTILVFLLVNIVGTKPYFLASFNLHSSVTRARYLAPSCEIRNSFTVKHDDQTTNLFDTITTGSGVGHKTIGTRHRGCKDARLVIVPTALTGDDLITDHSLLPCQYHGVPQYGGVCHTDAELAWKNEARNLDFTPSQ